MTDALERDAGSDKRAGDRSGLPRPLAIIGPTASGKSALALALAERLNGVIINADALQVYQELRILTARPSPEDESRVPHRLYGVLPGREACSAGLWRARALAEIVAAQAAGRRPLLVGGTGLYFRALEQGLAPVPTVPEAVRRATQATYDKLGAAAFHQQLVARDPASALLRPSDTQRLLRAWEVLEASGQPLSHWQQLGHRGLPLQYLALLPPREALRAAAARRFATMLEGGALDEVRALLALGLDPALPVMKAVGVRELGAVLRGALSLSAASQAAITATRQYLKRQTTWIRGQLLSQRDDVLLVDEQFSESLPDKIFPILLRNSLTG